MPIDQLMLNPMLTPFRDMAEDCKTKGYAGESFDQMMQALARMEELGQEMDDFMAFSAKMTTENLQMNFSLAYGRVLSEGNTQQNESSSAYDDDALLKQTLDALKNVVIELKENEKRAITEAQKHHASAAQKNLAQLEISTLSKTELFIAPIEALITYGESGVNFPTFLRVQIEKGLDKAIEGSQIVKESINYELDFAKAAATHPFDIAAKTEQARAFKTLESESKLGVPNSLSVNLAFNNIRYSYVPRINKWKAIESAWEKIFSLLDTWTLAQTKFAPHIEPWVLAGNTAKINAAIEKDKATLPGIIQERVRLLSKNFEVNFNNLFAHETFIWSVQHHHFSYSQVYTTLVIKTIFTNCQPGQLLNKSIIREVERIYENKEMPNPENYKVLDRQEIAYNKHFGEGNFTVKFGPKQNFGTRNASPWNL